jgi:hypothetical protein
LVDLGDAVADEMELEFDRISLEMLMRGLYHFSVARQRGLADDPVKYFAAPENQDLVQIQATFFAITCLRCSTYLQLK